MRKQVHGCGAQQLFAANTRRIRLERKLTQEKVAELADLHPNYVSSVERSERNIDTQQCSLDCLCGYRARSEFVAEPAA